MLTTEPEPVKWYCFLLLLLRNFDGAEFVFLHIAIHVRSHAQVPYKVFAIRHLPY